jgi:hypothetical protein
MYSEWKVYLDSRGECRVISFCMWLSRVFVLLFSKVCK